MANVPASSLADYSTIFGPVDLADDQLTDDEADMCVAGDPELLASVDLESLFGPLDLDKDVLSEPDDDVISEADDRNDKPDIEQRTAAQSNGDRKRVKHRLDKDRYRPGYWLCPMLYCYLTILKEPGSSLLRNVGLKSDCNTETNLHMRQLLPPPKARHIYSHSFLTNNSVLFNISVRRLVAARRRGLRKLEDALPPIPSSPSMLPNEPLLLKGSDGLPLILSLPGFLTPNVQVRCANTAWRLLTFEDRSV